MLTVCKGQPDRNHTGNDVRTAQWILWHAPKHHDVYWWAPAPCPLTMCYYLLKKGWGETELEWDPSWNVELSFSLWIILNSPLMKTAVQSRSCAAIAGTKRSHFQTNKKERKTHNSSAPRICHRHFVPPRLNKGILRKKKNNTVKSSTPGWKHFLFWHFNTSHEKNGLVVASPFCFTWYKTVTLKLWLSL